MAISWGNNQHRVFHTIRIAACRFSGWPGYAYAGDQICRFADIMATVNAQRSRYFGPDASYGDLGGQTNNLESDFFFARINASGVVERLALKRYPDGPGADVRANVRGFVAGYNAYLRRTGRARLPDPRCRGKAWVRPLSPRTPLPMSPAKVGMTPSAA